MRLDLKKHLLVCFAITVGLAAFIDPFDALLASVGLGLLKELIDLVIYLYDMRKGRKPRAYPDLEDFVYSAIGAVLGYPVALLVFGG